MINAFTRPGVPPLTGASPPEHLVGRLSVSVHRPEPDRVLLRAHGEVDLGTVDGLRDLLAGVGHPDPAAGTGPVHVVCDLSGITFLGAVGVGALAEAGEAARRRGAALCLVATTRPVRRVLELCGLDRELPVASRLTDALDHRAAGAPAPRSAP